MTIYLLLIFWCSCVKDKEYTAFGGDKYTLNKPNDSLITYVFIQLHLSGAVVWKHKEMGLRPNKWKIKNENDQKRSKKQERNGNKS